MQINANQGVPEYHDIVLTYSVPSTHTGMFIGFTQVHCLRGAHRNEE